MRLTARHAWAPGTHARLGPSLYSLDTEGSLAPSCTSPSSLPTLLALGVPPASCLCADNTPTALSSLTSPLSSRLRTQPPPSWLLCLVNATHPGLSSGALPQPSLLLAQSPSQLKASLPFRLRDLGCSSTSPFPAAHIRSASQPRLLPFKHIHPEASPPPPRPPSCSASPKPHLLHGSSLEAVPLRPPRDALTPQLRVLCPQLYPRRPAE